MPDIITGVIINSQSPIIRRDFPKNIGTAEGLSHLNKLPVIVAGDDATSKKDACETLGKLANGSIIYIVGHDEDQNEASSSDVLNSEYPASTLKKREIITWSPEQYRDLILKNAPALAPGSILTIVIWACRAGEGGYDSFAVRLGRLFADHGVSTRILASTEDLDSFDGRYSSREREHGGLLYKASLKSLRLFDCQAGNPVILAYKTALRIYCSTQCLKGFMRSRPIAFQSAMEYTFFSSPDYHPSMSCDVVKVKTAQSFQGFMHSRPIAFQSALEYELFSSLDYYPSMTRDEAETKLAEAPAGQFILRDVPSIMQARIEDARMFCASVRCKDGNFGHFLFTIQTNGKLSRLDNNQKTEILLKLLPSESLIQVITRTLAKKIGLLTLESSQPGSSTELISTPSSFPSDDSSNTLPMDCSIM